MINKKRVNKVTKLTVASAIAFSALAQPLGTLVTVKAAEAPATTKAENKLLQSTTSTESANQNLKSNLKASKPVIENPNLVFDTSTGTIPGWKVGMRDFTFYYGTYDQDYLRKDLPIVSTGVNSRYIVDNNRQFLLGAYSSGGLEITLDTGYSWTHDVIYQTVKTVPGEEYTFSFPAIATTGCPYDDHVRIGSNIVDNTTEGTITSNVESLAVGRLNISRDYSTTFTARSTETRVEIVLARAKGNGYADSMLVKLTGGVSVTPTDTTAPDAPTVTPVYDTDTNIKGSGEANCDVKVTLESGDIVRGRTDASGNFDITIPAQAAGKEIKVTLTDGAGNESNPTTVTVLATAIATPTIGAVTTDDTTVK
ncbi:hypothetical protein HB884_06065 [Listeria booriae]|nr:Ig-like domain-containing protein [Listeria booriae]MBC1523770.1 hypothetical protein [Listeria booriae]